MGIVYKPLPAPTTAVALAYWFEQATGQPPAPGVDPRPLAMQAWYLYERGRACKTMERQRQAFPFLRPPPPPPWPPQRDTPITIGGTAAGTFIAILAVGLAMLAFILTHH